MDVSGGTHPLRRMGLHPPTHAAMRLHKTPKARAVLASQGIDLSPAERRILIICDGRRPRSAIETMLGAEAAGSIEVLLAQGYLVADTSDGADAPPPLSTPASVAGTLAGRLFGRTREKTAPASIAPAQPPPTAVAPVPPTAPQALAQPNASRSRRSMSAARMYMLDMLRLQRSLDAASIAVAIQTSSGERELADAFIEALACVRATTKDSVAGRIAERLFEVLPESQVEYVQSAWHAMGQSHAPTEPPHPGNVIRMTQRGAA